MLPRRRSLLSTTRVAALLAATLILPAFFSGCNLLAAANSKRSHPIAADYRGLDDKSVAIVVYAAEANTDEFPGARKEISNFIANEIRLHMPTVRLVNFQDIINWQDDTRNWFGLTGKEIGKHFSVDRVLYIELIDYETKSTVGYGDLQGHIRANCKVYEVNTPGDAPAWTGVVDSAWPEDRPVSSAQVNESAVRLRTLEIFAQDLVGYFYEHDKTDIPLKDR